MSSNKFCTYHLTYYIVKSLRRGIRNQSLLGYIGIRWRLKDGIYSILIAPTGSLIWWRLEQNKIILRGTEGKPATAPNLL